MTTPLDRIPPVSSIPTPGKDAMRRSIQVETMMLTLRNIALRATLRGSSPVKIPDDFVMWAKDLRRGRMTITGSFKRFVDLIESRHMGQEGRELAREAWDVASEYLDLALPETPEKIEPLNTRPVDISSETRKARLSHVAHYGRTNRSA